MDEVLDVEVTADGQGEHNHPGLFKIFLFKNKLNIQSKILVSLADFERYTIGVNANPYSPSDGVIYEQPLIP